MPGGDDASGRGKTLAIDIGSTNCRYAVGSGSGGIETGVRTRPTRVETLGEDLTTIVERSLSKFDRIEHVAISVGGVVSTHAGVIDRLETARGNVVREFEVVDRLESRFDVGVTVVNDCAAGAIGEWEFGAGRGVDTICHVTIASGVGAGVVDHGHLLRGEEGSAAEIGLFPVNSRSERDRQGVRGAWEAFASGEGIASFVRDRLESESRETVLEPVESLDARELFRAVDAGDDVARSYLDEVGRTTTAGLATTIHAYDPGRITVGGSVALNNWDALMGVIDTYWDEYVLFDVERPQLTPLGADVELQGCTALRSFFESDR